MGDVVTVIRRAECPRCGRHFAHQDNPATCSGVWTLNQHEPTPWEWVEYVRADAYQGAVKALENIAGWSTWTERGHVFAAPSEYAAEVLAAELAKSGPATDEEDAQ